MAGLVAGGNCGRGPIPYWLGLLSVGARAHERLTALRDAIKKLGPTYEGLERAFDEFLAVHHCNDANFRRRIADHLRHCWFSDHARAYYPGQKVTQMYAEAVLKAIELSLNGRHHPVPINAWWIVQPGEKAVKMLTLAEVDRNGMTVSSSVTLLIITPNPRHEDAPTKTVLWSDAEAWLTQEHNGAVTTKQIDKEVK